MRLGKRLRQLRLARGLTQEELAAKIDHAVTKQAISQYENGHAVPRSSVLRQLARALEVSPAELLSEPELSIQPIAFRCRQSLHKQAREQIEQIVSLELERRLRIERLLGLRTVLPLQQFPVHTESDAERAACALRQLWQLGTDPIGSIVQTLETHGVHVIQVEAPESFDGVAAIARDERGVPVGAAVAIRTGLPGERQRLSLAHELGHLTLKVDEALDEEKLAFRFGAAFLAPQETLLAEVGLRRTDISLDELLLLKQRYGMSLQAILYRLRDLYVISEAYYRRWMQTLSRQRWRKREPMELPEETPHRFRQLLLRAVAEQLIRSDEAERLLGEPLDLHTPRPLSVRRALLLLPRELRTQILEAQAERAAHEYALDTEERSSWQGGDILDDEGSEAR